MLATSNPFAIAGDIVDPVMGDMAGVCTEAGMGAVVGIDAGASIGVMLGALDGPSLGTVNCNVGPNRAVGPGTAACMQNSRLAVLS